MTAFYAILVLLYPAFNWQEKKKLGLKEDPRKGIKVDLYGPYSKIEQWIGPQFGDVTLDLKTCNPEDVAKLNPKNTQTRKLVVPEMLFGSQKPSGWVVPQEKKVNNRNFSHRRIFGHKFAKSTNVDVKQTQSA